MNIVILGAGTKGSYLAKLLSNEEHNVFLIDKNQITLKKVGEEADIATLYGDSTWSLLQTLTEHKPSLFIAMTGDDNSNLISCSIAKNLGYPLTICRIKDNNFLIKPLLDFKRLFFVDYFLGTEILTALDILKNIMNPQDLAIENFAHGRIQMKTIIIPDTWSKKNTPLIELGLPKELLIGLIKRTTTKTKEEHIIFPTGKDFLLPNDEITVVGETIPMQELHSIFNCPKEKIKSVVIAGGNNIALTLAQMLQRLNIKTKIIEKDEKKCDKLAGLLPKTSIIHQDATNYSFLETEQINTTDFFIVCTSNDKTNVLISLLGKQLGCKKILTLTSDIKLNPILRNMGIHYSPSEKIILKNKISSIINAKKMISIESLYENQAIIFEAKVSETSKITSIPLSDLRSLLPKKLIIAAIENKGNVMIGKGDRVLSPNDSLIIICAPEHLNETQKLF